MLRHAARLALITLLVPAAAATQDTTEIRIDRQEVAAGRLVAGALHADLEVVPGRWRPQGTAGPAIPVLAFAEHGRAPQNPGPLLRVRTGATVEVSVHNRSRTPLTVHGLLRRPGMPADSFPLGPDERRTMRFTAPAPGTYFYAAVRRGEVLLSRYAEDSQLNGFLIVDPEEGPAHPDERFFLISWWFQDPDTMKAVPAMGTMVINGRPWPYTERFSVTTGDTMRWRWVNVTDAPHPMHLHGFYFTVEGSGDGIRDTAYAPEQRRLAVTERLAPGHSMQISWVPERPGNWLFHCHFAFHVSHNVSLVQLRDFSDEPPAAHAGHGMGGLALGIHVRPRAARLVPAAQRPTRQIRLLIRSHPHGYGEHPAYYYALDGADSETVPGPVLALQRGQPVAVTLLNRSHEPAAVHWHGIELESFPDGVPGWSGEGAELLRPISPGDSLVVRFTPPRAGTFMYHSHFNELQQIASGLYGALVVLPDEAPLDAERDHVLLLSTGGVPSETAPILLNGQAAPAALRMVAGAANRLRFINIMANGGVVMRLTRDGVPVTWTLVAKDGADLPAHQRTPTAATGFRIVAGETYDFEITPAPGEMVLRYLPPERPPTEVRVIAAAGAARP